MTNPTSRPQLAVGSVKPFYIKRKNYILGLLSVLKLGKRSIQLSPHRLAAGLKPATVITKEGKRDISVSRANSPLAEQLERLKINRVTINSGVEKERLEELFDRIGQGDPRIRAFSSPYIWVTYARP